LQINGLMDIGTTMKCAQSLGEKASCPNTYIFGAIAPGVGLIVAGVVFLVVWIISYFIACCTACCPRTKCCPARDRSVGGKFEKCAKVVPIVRAVLGLITCALVLGGLGSVPRFPGGLTAVTALVDNFSGTVGSLVTLLSETTTTPVQVFKLDGTSEGLVSPLAAVNAAALNFSAVNADVNTASYPTCGMSPSGTCTQQAVATMISALTTALTAAGGGNIKGAKDAMSDVQTMIKNSLGSISLKGLETQITMYAMAALGVIAAIIVFQAVLVCRHFLACCAFKSL
jgi:hypothetical protein